MYGTSAWLVVMLCLGLRMLLLAPKLGPPATAVPLCEAGFAVVERRGLGVECVAGAISGDVLPSGPAVFAPTGRSI